MGDYVRWAGLWTLHRSIHGLGFRSLPEYDTIGFGCGVDAGKGGDQLALLSRVNARSVIALGTPPCSTVTSPKYLLSARAPAPKPIQEKQVRTSDIFEPKGSLNNYVLHVLAIIS